MLTGRNAVHERVAAFEAGASDYLAKPFAMDELIARTQALMRQREKVGPLAQRDDPTIPEPSNHSLSSIAWLW
jgi:DNA-binding response OmpR family regulator